MADTRKKMPRPVAVADLLTSAFQGKPAETRLKEGRIWLVWDKAVGAQIAGKAHPVSFRDGVLTVAVASAPWMNQLTFLKQGMIDNLNRLLGSDLVRDIYLKAGMTKPISRQPEPRKTMTRQLTEEEVRLIGEQTAGISDPGLREAFARILARTLTTRDTDSP